MVVVSKTPFRISLAGGGSDIPGFYKNNEYGEVLSFTINKYIYLFLKELSQEFPYKYKLGYANIETCNSVKAIQHNIFRACIYKFASSAERFDISVLADIPAGTGMGSSSAFTVGLINALYYYNNAVISPLEYKNMLASYASYIEIQDLGAPIGKQDQYAAAFGGINSFRFNADGTVEATPIVIDFKQEKKFLDSFYLFYLNLPPRNANDTLSQLNHDEIVKQMRDLVPLCRDALTYGTPEDLGALIHQGWELKRQLPGVSNTFIDQVYEQARAQGAYGGRLLGAGQSGYLFLVAPPRTTFDLGLLRVPFKIDYQGSRIYEISD